MDRAEPSAREKFEAVAVLLHERAKGLPAQFKPWGELTEAEREQYLGAVYALVGLLTDEPV